MNWTFETRPSNCFTDKAQARFNSTDFHAATLPEGTVEILHGSLNGATRIEVRIRRNNSRTPHTILDLLKEEGVLRVLRAEVVEDGQSRKISSIATRTKVGALLKRLREAEQHPQRDKLKSLITDLSSFSSLEQPPANEPIDYKLLFTSFSRQKHGVQGKLLGYLRSVSSMRGVEISDSTSKKLVKGAFAKGSRKVVIPRLRPITLLHNAFATGKIRLIEAPSTQEDYKQALIAAFLLKILPELPPGVEPWEFERLRCALQNEGNTSKLLAANKDLPLEMKVNLAEPFALPQAQFTPPQREIHRRALQGDKHALIAAHHLGLEGFPPYALSVIATQLHMPLGEVQNVVRKLKV